MSDDIPHVPITPFELAVLAQAIAHDAGEMRAHSNWQEYFTDAYELHYEATKFLCKVQEPKAKPSIMKQVFPVLRDGDPMIKAMVEGASSALKSIMVDDAVAVAALRELIRQHPVVGSGTVLDELSDQAWERYSQAMNGHPLTFPTGISGKAIKLMLSLWDCNASLVSEGHWRMLLARAKEKPTPPLPPKARNPKPKVLKKTKTK